MFACKDLLLATLLVVACGGTFGAVILGGCKGTQFGCCDDGKTSAGGPNKENCVKIGFVGGCKGTRYGCCPDGVTSASGANGLGCRPATLVGGCKGTRYGCCPDGVKSASGANGLGCDELIVS